MSEPTLICSAPELANSAQKIALYSHYAATVAGFAVCGVMAARSRVQEKIPHILAAVAAFGVGCAAFYSQWEFNQFLYQHRETASFAVGLRAGLWALWSTLILVGLALTPGLRFKRMKKLALIPLIACAVLSFGLGSAGESLTAFEATVNPPAEVVEATNDFKAFKTGQFIAANMSALVFGIPASVLALLIAGTYAISQAKKVERRSEENHQMRTGVMTTVAVCVPALVYGAGSFLVAKDANGLDQAVLLFNCADVISMFFLLSATMSLLGVPANFPKPPKPQKAKKAAPPPAEAHPNVLDQQQAYAQAYAQQLLAQQQAYAAYQQQQQAYAAQQAAYAAQQQQQAQQQAQSQQPAQAAPEAAPAPAAQPQTAPQGNVDPAAAAAAYQQQAQYYAQQQAYAAYQQQQQAYQQAYAAAQTQQQVYAQAYAQQQAAYRQQQPVASTATTAPHAHGVRKVSVGGAHPAAAHGVKKVGNVRQIKKIR